LHGVYITSEEFDAVDNFGLYFRSNLSNGILNPQSYGPKYYGSHIRCVRDTVPLPAGCNNNTPGWGNSLGTVRFATDSIWVVGNQVWSDAVTATACASRTTQFRGGSNGNYNADCRSNPGYKGDLFSWCAVARFQDQLCPAPWRVPTQQDFFNLDIALGGNAQDRSESESTVRDRFINRWGGAFNGGCWETGIIGGSVGIDEAGYYWSITSHYFYIFLRRVNPATELGAKGWGLSLRCVRNN